MNTAYEIRHRPSSGLCLQSGLKAAGDWAPRSSNCLIDLPAEHGIIQIIRQMTKKPMEHPTEEEIDEIVTDQADDDSAWCRTVHVGREIQDSPVGIDYRSSSSRPMGRADAMDGIETNQQGTNERVRHIESRIAQLQPLRSKYAEEAMRFLFLVNSGGAAAILGYLGTGTDVVNQVFAKWSLCCFVLGIIFIGCVRWTLMLRSYRYCDAWEQKAPASAQTEEKWAQFVEDDKKRTAGHRREFTFGYLSIASLLGGLILGALGLVL